VARYSHPGHRSLRVFLEKTGFRTERSRGWQSLTIEHLVKALYPRKALETARKALNNTCQRPQGVAGLVKQVGNGIALLISFQTTSQSR
jgi:hypothetical protein